MTKKEEEKEILIQTRVEPSLFARVEEQAKREDRSIASWLRRTIAEKLAAAP